MRISKKAKNTILLLLFTFALPAYADKADRIQEEIAELKKDQRAKNTELSKAKAELAQAEAEVRAKKPDAEANRDKAKLKVDVLESAILSLKDEVKDLQKKLDREEEAKTRAENCVECKKGAAAPHKGKNGWENFAEIVKAVTPLGLGAMNTYGSVKAMNQQSSDYQLYANTMSANGLPFAQNTNSYANFFGMNMNGSSMGGMGSMGGFNMMGMSGMGGMGYNNFYGLNGMNGGYVGYGGYGGNSAYGNYGSSAYAGYGGYGNYGASNYGYNAFTGGNAYNGYNSSYYSAQQRQQAQYSISSSDTQAATVGLNEAQQRYYQALGLTYGTSYNSGYYGSGTYSPTNYYQYNNGTTNTASGYRQ